MFFQDKLPNITTTINYHLNMFLLLSVIAILVTPALAQVDCTGKADGPHGVGCYSYTQCTGGSGTTIECRGGKVFDANATPPGCNDIAAVTTSCSFIDDCGSVSGDVRFAVPGDCSHFYRCTRGKFKGVHPCAYPTNPLLVFDFNTQVCNWAWFTPSPCGTAQGGIP